jgi:hypothetical protein
MSLHQKIEVTNDMQRNLFAEDQLENSLFNWEEEVCSLIVFSWKQKLYNSVKYLVFPCKNYLFLV